jgi:hypothetical protein
MSEASGGGGGFRTCPLRLAALGTSPASQGRNLRGSACFLCLRTRGLERLRFGRGEVEGAGHHEALRR